MNMTNTEWVQLNMITGEVKPLEDEHPKRRRSDAAFVALVKLCGYDNQPLTDSLRGALNKSRGQIVRAERERNRDVSLDEISDLIIGFKSWFLSYRRNKFNEVCRRSPYPMETAKLWPMYRLQDVNNVAQDWLRVINRDEPADESARR